MQCNDIILTEDHWQQFSAELRQDLRQVLKRKSAIVGCQVLELASALCDRHRPDVALALYDTLAGEPGANHGCGFGAMWALKQYMGERGPDPTSTLLIKTTAR